MCKICALKQNKEWGNNSKQACTSKKQPDGQNVMSKGKMKVTASQFPIRSIFQCISSVFRWVKSTVQSVHQVFNVSDYISKTYFQMFHLVVFVFFFNVFLVFFMVSVFPHGFDPSSILTILSTLILSLPFSSFI